MILILEGCDLSGKTTLGQRLAKEFPGIYLKITDKPKDGSPEEIAKIKEHHRWLFRLIRDNPKLNFVLDRFFPSEQCYSMIKRDYEAFSDPDYIDMEKGFCTDVPDHLFIFCNPGEDILKQRMEERGDDYVTPGENLLVHRRYMNYFIVDPARKESGMKILGVNTNASVEDLVARVKEHLNG